MTAPRHMTSNNLTKSANEGSNIRGQRADWIYLDEMDYLSEGDVTAITAISIEAPDAIGIWASSTPTGKRAQFYRWCMEAQGLERLTVPPGKYTTHNPLDKDSSKWVEFYYPSMCLPTWGPAQEKEFRSMYSELAYTHEVLADFGEEMVGVFNKADVAACRDMYEYVERPQYAAIRTIGVDWDKYGAATNIIVTEFDPRAMCYRVINRVEIQRSERTLSNAVNKIVLLDKVYNPTHIYVDRGYGEMQVEFLGDKIGKKVRGIQFSEKIEVIDPTTKLMDKKHMKPFMVNNAAIIVERRRLKISAGDEDLYKQMMDYHVVRETILGQPVFSSENEHALDALMLSLLAFTIEHPELESIIKKTEYASRMVILDKIPFMDVGVEDKEERVVVRERYSGAPTWGPRGYGPKNKAMTQRKRL